MMDTILRQSALRRKISRILGCKGNEGKTRCIMWNTFSNAWRHIACNGQLPGIAPDSGLRLIGRLCLKLNVLYSYKVRNRSKVKWVGLNEFMSHYRGYSCCPWTRALLFSEMPFILLQASGAKWVYHFPNYTNEPNSARVHLQSLPRFRDLGWVLN